jgi:hypothetical protein
VLRRILERRRDEVTEEWRRLQGASCSVLLTKYHSGDQIKNTEISGACSTYAGEERCIQGFGRET